MTTNSSDKAFQLEQPFPLNSLFRRRFVPAFFGFALLFLFLLGFTAQQVVHEIYLEQAQRRAETMARAVKEMAPDAWAHLMAGQTLTDLQNSSDANALAEAFATEAREMALSELKIYDLETRVLFATHRDEIGTKETGAALKNVILSGTPDLVTKTLADGSQQYELYVPVFDAQNRVQTVFELYEPVSYLNTILVEAAVPTIAVPTLLLAILVIALNVVVGRAQTDIDLRTGALKALQERLSSFVSMTAIDAARHADASGKLASEKMVTTIFYSDIRGFTGFSEANSAEDVVAFLNDLMGLQVAVVQTHGGDVDKMIGDAILARFDGDDGAARAVLAAKDIQRAVLKGTYPRGLGIGIHRGEVISGAIGPESRRDYTVIGDAVNVAARLCSEAAAGEIVVTSDLATALFGPEQEIVVKGKKQPLRVRRLEVNAEENPSA